MDELLGKIKDSMRIKHTALDTDIKDDIEAAIADMIRVGIQPYSKLKKKELKPDKLIRKAIELYCKWQADFLGKGTQFEASYEKLRDAMSLCGDYNE